MENLGTVMGVWAHPDDDIYLSAGLMHVAASAGERVMSTSRPPTARAVRWTRSAGQPSSMRAVRTAELMRSLEILGIEEHRFLDGPVDVDMDTPLDGSGAEQVREIMAEIRPRTVLPFGPDGMTGNTAHKDVCRWATEAFRQVAPTGARLYYATSVRDVADEWVPRLEPFGS